MQARQFICQILTVSARSFSRTTDYITNYFTKFCFKDLNFLLQQFFNFSQNIYTSCSLFYISMLYEFLDLKIIILPFSQ